MDTEQLDNSVNLIQNTIRNGHMIYVCGNGGSAAISLETAAVWMKWVNQNTADSFRAKVVSLACNSPLITAISNDMGYENVFSYQLNTLLEPGDIVVTISSSGNSPNIVNAIKTAKMLENECISFSGFSGGYSKIADINIHVESDEYCLIEDAHHALSHFICRKLIFNQTEYERKKNEC